MTAGIFGERFASYRQPAWHRLGEVLEKQMSAVQALRKIGGDDQIVTMEPVQVKVAGKTIALPDYRAVMRHPTPDDDEYRVFNVVSKDYQPITMADVASIADEFVAEHVETIGILGQGERGFLTFKLPAIDVRGDEVEMYLGATYSFVGAATVEVWPLRVVCQNTLAIAQARAETAYRVVHDETAKERMGAWMADAYNEAKAKSDLLREAFTALAKARTTPAGVKKVIAAAYPDPKTPALNAPNDVIEQREKYYEQQVRRIGVFRSEANRLIAGDMTGFDKKAVKGTYWGAVQGIAEMENYRKASFIGGKEGEKAATAVLFGARRDVMSRATATALDLAKVTV